MRRPAVTGATDGARDEGSMAILGLATWRGRRSAAVDKTLDLLRSGGKEISLMRGKKVDSFNADEKGAAVIDRATLASCVEPEFQKATQSCRSIS